MRLHVLAFAALFLLGRAPVEALDRALPPSTLGATSADTIVLRKPGSTGNASAFDAVAKGLTVRRSLEERFGEAPSVLDFGVDMTGVADSSVALTAALNSGKAVTAPCGTIRITSTVLVTKAYPKFRGAGDCTVLLFDAPARVPATPALQVRPSAIGGVWEDFKVDHQGQAKNFAPPANGNPIVGTALIFEANYTKVSRLTVVNGWDNCIALTELPSSGPGFAVTGQPKFVSTQTTRTQNCGWGTRAGGGLNVASSSSTVVDDHVDVESFGAFGVDIGAGANGTFSNVTGIGTRFTGYPTYTFYIGEAGSTYTNFTAINPGHRGLWVDGFAERSVINNMNIKAPASDGVLIKAPNITINNLVVNSPGYGGTDADAIIFDSSASPLRNVLMSNVSIQGEFKKARKAFVGVGSNAIDVSILNANTSGANSDGNLPASSSVVSGVALGSRWKTYVPTVQCTTGGSPATPSSISGSYRRTGRTVDLQVSVAITGTGTCDGALQIGLPFPPAGRATFTGSESAATGTVLSAVAYENGFHATVKKYDGTSAVVAGYTVSLSGTYEIQ